MLTSRQTPVRIGLLLIGVLIAYLLVSRSKRIGALEQALEEARSGNAVTQESALSRSISTATETATKGSEDKPGPLEYPFGHSKDAGLRTVTAEELKESLAMNDRAANGEYILMWERPLDRKVMVNQVKEWASQQMEDRSQKLGATLSGLGVSDDVQRRLKTHQEKVLRASIEAELAMQQVLTARLDYDQAAKSAMTPDAYAAYRDYEDAVPAVRELGSIRDFADRNGLTLDPTQESQLQSLIKAAGAYTEKGWHGPYDGLPEPAMGQDAATAATSIMIQSITETSTALRQSISTANLPEELQQLVRAYYDDRLAQKQRVLSIISNPKSTAPAAAAQ
jgi:hypothetical protein